MAKRRKMTWYDLGDRSIDFVDFTPNVLHKPTGIKGTMYRLAEPLSDEDRDFIMSWKNTLISSCRYRYAPEIEGECIFIAYKCMR